MVKISAFQSLRPEKKIVTKVPTKAYSNYSKKEIIKETLNNQYSFLNIISQRNKQSRQKKFENVRKKIDEFNKKCATLVDCILNKKGTQ